ncbi:MAG: diguanylate cyclase [Wenzhouxiangella sp.]|jgi:diguanylate cyclase (GGDEF)-like protein|nr:diguanylate cyclase [Wenzhouxiangella sp.]
MDLRSQSHRFLVGAGLTSSWLLLWGLGHLAELSTHASVWYPPAALTFAALLVIGRHAIPYLLIANLAATLWAVWLYDIDVGWLKVVGGGTSSAVAHIGCYGFGAAALRAIAERHQHNLSRIVIAFLGIATVASMATTIGVIGSLAGFDLLQSDEIKQSLMAFWVGDFVGLVVLGPLFAAVLIKLVRSPAFWIQPLDTLRHDSLTGSFGLKLSISLVLVSAAMLTAAAFGTVESAFLIFFLLIPQMWLTHSESPLRTALSLGAVSFLIVIWLGVLNLAEFVFIYQFAIAIVATTAYFGLSIPLLVSDNEQLRARLMFDPLTGVNSRDLLLFQSARELARVERGATSCLAVVDLDRFKSINDRYGHLVGDRALIRLAEIMREQTRATDLVARYGGDEFVILYPDTKLEDASQRLGNLREAFGKSMLMTDDHLTISIGLAEAKAGETFESWFERADLALLSAKREGRDRVKVSPRK